jgi:hypothetical protein
MGDESGKPLRRFLRAMVLALLLSTTVAACLAEPRQPDLSTREEFARSVMAAAVSGSVERVESLVDPVFTNVRPEAQQLVDSARGWTPGSWQLGISNDFPAVASATASRDGTAAIVRYSISWRDERWSLVLGESKNLPGGATSPGAKAFGPGSAPKILPGETVPSGRTSSPTTLSQPPAVCPVGAGRGVAPGPWYGAAALTCRTFTSTWGSVRGQNMYWLTSSPLHLSFDKTNGALALVVRMPCGVLNVPVSVDDFGIAPDPARMAESAEGCAGPTSEYRSWTTAYFKESMVYRLDSSELVLTNELGQIRFKQD